MMFLFWFLDRLNNYLRTNIQGMLNYFVKTSIDYFFTCIDDILAQ